jgi:hypothetical protein
MDICAELTLRVARLSQEHKVTRRSLSDWFFVPAFRKATWSEAHDILAAAPKPLIVAPLIEPGYLATWSVEDVDPTQRIGAERHLENLEEYFPEKLRALGLEQAELILFSAAETELKLTLADFRRWTREYAVAVGVTVDKTPESGVGRLLVRPPGGGGPPLGLPTDTLRPAT